jgi:hypothetical protein
MRCVRVQISLHERSGLGHGCRRKMADRQAGHAGRQTHSETLAVDLTSARRRDNLSCNMIHTAVHTCFRTATAEVLSVMFDSGMPDDVERAKQFDACGIDGVGESSLGE